MIHRKVLSDRCTTLQKSFLASDAVRIKVSSRASNGNMSKSILITDKVHQILVSGLKKRGFEVKYAPRMSYPQVQKEVASFDGIIINSKVVCDQPFLQRFQHLDFIGRLGSGLDIIDLKSAAERGIEVISSPEGNANAVGEHTLGMLLTLMHHISNAQRDVHQLNWNREPNRGTELKGMTVGIIGFGHTGPAFANKLRGAEVDILVYDKYRKGLDQIAEIQNSPLDELLQRSDIVSIHLPLTEETKYMVNEHFLSRMKKGAILINTSRGKIVDTSALKNALEEGRLRGACLDVLENEKPETWADEERSIYESVLLRKNVIVTPHIAGWTHESLKLIAEILLHKIVAFYEK